MKYFFADELPEDKEVIEPTSSKGGAAAAAAAAEFDFESVSSSMCSTLTYENDSISIYAVSSQPGKSYTLVVYKAIKSTDDLRSIESFYEELISAQTAAAETKATPTESPRNPPAATAATTTATASTTTTTTTPLKGLLRIYHIARIGIDQSQKLLLQTRLPHSQQNNNQIEEEKPPQKQQQQLASTSCQIPKRNSKPSIDQNNFSNSAKSNTRGCPTCHINSESNNNSNNNNPQQHVFVFFETFEFSIEEDIIERSLNQNNVLCERQILDSFQDIIDCFVELGYHLVSRLVVSSDFLVVGKERLAKILAIYEKRETSFSPRESDTAMTTTTTTVFAQCGQNNMNISNQSTNCKTSNARHATSAIAPSKGQIAINNGERENCSKVNKLVPFSVESDIEKELPRKTRSQTLNSRLEALASHQSQQKQNIASTAMELEATTYLSSHIRNDNNSNKRSNSQKKNKSNECASCCEKQVEKDRSLNSSNDLKQTMSSENKHYYDRECERSACYELSLIYLRVSAFLSRSKFNPQKKHLDMRLLQIISTLLEYKISGLFEEIFQEVFAQEAPINPAILPATAPCSRRQQCCIDQFGSQEEEEEEEEEVHPTTIFTFANLSASVRRFRDQRVLFEIDSTTNLEKLFPAIANKSEVSIHFKDKTFNRLQELEEIFEKKSTDDPLVFNAIHTFEFKSDLCNLCDEGAQTVARILSYLSPLRIESLVLSLRRNSISSAGISAISGFVAQCFNLRVFRVFFSYNRVRNAGLTSVIRSLSKLERLEVLDLRFFENQISEEGCKAFEELVDLTFVHVKYLNISLGNNTISNEGCRCLAKFLSGMRNLKQLSIFLESNQITSEGLTHLRTAFVRKNQIRLLILHLLCNRINDEGMLLILKNISKLTTLNSFEIILNENTLTEKTGIALGAAIKNMVHLTSLILSIRANKIANQGAAALGESLRSLKNLESLVLSLTNNNIGDEGGIPIGTNLKYLTKLQKLHLVFYENSVSVKSGKAIGNGLKNLTELNYLILGIGDNKIGDEGALAIGSSLSFLKKVKIFEIYLQNNQVGSVGASAIATGLKSMKLLKCLVFQLQHSQFGDIPMIALGRSLSNLTQLSSLDIYVERCGIGSLGGMELFQGIARLQKLRIMVLDFDSNSVGVLGGQTLGQSFETMHSLVDLKVYFKKNTLLQAGSTALLNGIAHLKKLRSLNVDLYKNQAGDASLIAFGQSLAQLKSLRNLELSITFNGLTVDGARQFSEYFAQCTALQEVYLYMQKNHLREDAAAHISKAISCLSELLSLKISFGNNQIVDQGITSIIEGIANCKKLRVLFLYAYNIGMTGAGCISIAENIRKLPALERFDFFTNSNRAITLKEGLSQLAQTVIQNHQTLQMINVDHLYWEQNIKSFMIPRSLNCVLNMQIVLFNRFISKILPFHPRAILWDLFVD